MKSLDPAALDCLAALADDASFERAAHRLSITQSAVSQRLRVLEAQVGRPLVVRSRPLRLTEPGKVLLRFARQWQVLRSEAVRALGDTGPGPVQRVPIAVNADSLATWVLPALDPLVHAGRREGWALELVVDDEDFTHDSLREGRVLGCVSALAEALRGCAVRPLGAMRYAAVASPGFVAQELPGGLGPANFTRVPFLVFDRKDDLHTRWAERAFGIAEPRLQERHVPSNEAYLQAACMGWGIALMPEIQARPMLRAARLVRVRPQVEWSVALYWHQWRLGAEDAAAGQPALLERIGAALAQGAAAALGKPVDEAAR